MKVKTIRKDKYVKGEFGQISKEGAYAAINKLSKEGLALYMFLTLNNANGFELSLGPTAFSNMTGVNLQRAKNTLTRGYAQLLEAGFIVEDQDGNASFYADGPMYVF